MATFALTGAAVFDGVTMLRDAAVVVADGVIEAVRQRGKLPDEV